MSNLSRRSIVASAAALPALAVPAVAFAVTAQPDPIYAAIEACLMAERADTEMCERLEEARVSFEAKYGREAPDAICKELREGWSKIKGLEDFSRGACDTHEAVNKLVDSMARHDKDAEKVRTPFHEELDRQTVAFNETVKPLEDAKNDAYERFDSLFQTMLDTRPTTLARLAALFACLDDNKMIREFFCMDYEYIDAFVATLGAATAQFARA
jgi:hypothetical protein